MHYRTPFIVDGEPSACSSIICVKPFSYTHNSNLTNNISEFTVSENNTQVL